MQLKSALITSGFLLITTVTFSQIDAFRYEQKKVLEVGNAAVVSAHPLASDAGLQMLRAGGNAVDAAIATQLALAVVYPGAGNLGGGGFLVARCSSGKTIAIDYREKAPAKAHKDMYLDAAGNPIKELSLKSQLASGVPGTVAGLFASLKYAKFDIKKLIAPAIRLAEKGFAVTAAQASSFNSNKAEFIAGNKNPVAFVKDVPWKAGDVLIQTQLAQTLKRIRDHGMKGFYEGETARLIVAEMKSGNGIISLNDLKNYKAKEREAMVFPYKGFEVITMPLPSSGGVIVQQMLKMIEHRNIGKMGFQTPESVQLMIEVERRAFADRANFLGDPDFVKVPLNTLVSKTYLAKRMMDYEQGKAGNSQLIKAGNTGESEETTHLSVIDKYGNVVSVTTTLNDGYGSKTVVSGAGFLLNNEMDDFSVKPGSPNMYGAIGNAANAITPNKRMLSSMTPTILLRNKKPYMIVGSPGGTTIPNIVFQSIVNIVDFNLSPVDAVNKPKFHHQWLPDTVYVERDFPEDVKLKLEEMGYRTTHRGAIGRTELIIVQPGVKKKIIAVADTRGDDSAAGY